MQRSWGLLVATAALLAPAAAATHAPLTIPSLQGDEPVDEALAWIEDTQLSESGCVDKQGCHTGWTKWVAVTVAHAGSDPSAWPRAGQTPGGWLLDNAEDLRDEKLERCQEDPNRSSADCADDRVFSLAKAILAVEATGEDARAVPLPDGGQRDLVAELLEEHDGSQFGRSRQANDDIWALVALNAADYEGPEVEDAIERIEQAQSVDGGVTYETGGTPTVDVTASAVMAVAPHDRQAFLDDAKGYLADQQLSDGDGQACWPLAKSAFSSEANAESTARAIQAIAALGEAPSRWSAGGRGPVECLLSFQGDAGGFRHADGARVELMATQQSLAALSWRPYGTVDGPVGTLDVADEATAGDEHTVRLPSGFLVVGQDPQTSHTWTPQEEGQRTFHGFLLDPARPATVVVHVEEDPQDHERRNGEGGGDASGGGQTGEQTDPRPRSRVRAPATVERNVTFPVHVNATPGQDPITGFRVQVGHREPTSWKRDETFSVHLTELGNHTVQAWSRDAEGRVSPAASTTVRVVDASPRLAIEGPSVVNRTEPATFVATVSDPDGPEPAVSWAARGQNATGTNATFTFPEPGRHRIHARAVDAAGNRANATFLLHAVNRPPAELTVEPRVLQANDTEVLEATATDPDGDPVAFTWDPVHGDARVSWGRQLHVETGGPGTLSYVVNASDPYGGWTRALVEVQVEEQAGSQRGEPAPLHNRTTGARSHSEQSQPTSPDEGTASIELPERIHARPNQSRLLHGSAHSPEGRVLNVTVALDEPVPVRGTSNFTALLPELPPGTYQLTARAADRTGWGPWTNATLVVDPVPPSEPLEQTSADPQRATPLGPLALLAGLLAVLGRRSP